MVKIFLTNLGKYNEGELVGEWVELPVSDKKLKEVKERIVINEKYEKWFITDYECDIDGLEIDEYSNVGELNVIAGLIDMMEDYKEVIEIYMSYYGNIEKLKLANAIVQADKIAYCSYIFKGIENCTHMGNIEKYGYTKAEQTGMYKQLEEIGADGYFDFEAYGKDDELNGYVKLSDNGYLSGNVNTDLYSWEELKKMI